MNRIYRVLRRAYARSPFDGEGAYRYGGRWSSPGTRLSYTSQHQSLAMLEYFVHFEADDPPNDLMLAVADVPDGISRQQLDLSELPDNWQETPAPAELTRLGDQFAAAQTNCIFVVPSALSPSENNWLINPSHPDFRSLLIRTPEPLSYDRRMFSRKGLGRSHRPRRNKSSRQPRS